MNYSGALTLRVTAADRDTLLDEIERLLDKAASAKSRTMRLADRAARFYAPMVHATAALTFVGWLLAGASLHDAVVTAIAVLIITCPCALALAIPAVQVVASGALFRAGVILNAGDAIERLAEADTVVFDKTGTLTLPEPRVVNAAAIDPDLLQMAARLALSSRHPLAVALAREGASARLRRRHRRAGAGRARHDRRRRSAARQRGILRRRPHRFRSFPARRRIARPDADSKVYRPGSPLARGRAGIDICFAYAGRSRPSRSPEAAAGCGRGGRGAGRARARPAHPVGRPRRRGARRSPRRSASPTGRAN